jgi:hypothetical protein
MQAFICLMELRRLGKRDVDGVGGRQRNFERSENRAPDAGKFDIDSLSLHVFSIP